MPLPKPVSPKDVMNVVRQPLLTEDTVNMINELLSLPWNLDEQEQGRNIKKSLVPNEQLEELATYFRKADWVVTFRFDHACLNFKKAAYRG